MLPAKSGVVFRIVSPKKPLVALADFLKLAGVHDQPPPARRR